jgi:ABC-type transport system involved in multi-copper enzyme maturation permease subunit
MKNLLVLEIAKVRHYPVFWVILAIYAAVVPAMFFGLGAVSIPFFPSKSDLFGFPTVWHYITWVSSWFNLLLGVLIVNLTCNEYTYRTQRQNIIDGLTRRQFLLGKILFYSFLAAVVTLYTFLIGFISGLIYSDAGNILENIEFLLYYFIQALGYFSFAYFFGALVKRPALSIVLFILIFLLRGLFLLFLDREIVQFIPINAMGDLIEMPFLKDFFIMVENGEGRKAEVPYTMSQTVRAIVVFGWVTFFMVTAYQIERRRDL